MITYSQHELDAKISAFLKKKLHQFPELRNERHYIERASSLKPIEKHHTSRRSQIFPSVRMHHAA